MCLYAPSPFSSMISASEIKFFLLISFIFACFHTCPSQRKARGGLYSFSAPISKWNPSKTMHPEKGDLPVLLSYWQSILKPWTPFLACRNKHQIYFCDLWGGCRSHVVHSTPPFLPFRNSYHCDLGKHMPWLLQARRKTCKMLWFVAMLTMST